MRGRESRQTVLLITGETRIQANNRTHLAATEKGVDARYLVIPDKRKMGRRRRWRFSVGLGEEKTRLK